uniref:Ig-like domain-containing protein n=1 Tax=Xenopus tropicalis TaxID=8364 RepID=A0A6I8RJH0_XENTR
MKDIFSLLILMKLVSCVICQITLDQPGSAVVNPSGTLKLSCKVSVSVSSQHWAWIWQAPGKGLVYIGLLNSGGSSIPAPSFQSRVTFTRDTSKNEIYLQMTSMKSEDSGTYYCARYTVTEGSEN